MEKNKLLRKATLGYINIILEDALLSKDSKPLFRHLKTQKTDNSGITPLKDGEQVYSDARFGQSLPLTRRRMRILLCSVLAALPYQT